MDAHAIPRSVTAADLLSLTKPRLSSLVLCTVAGGMWLAPGQMALGARLVTLLAIAGTVGAANALNCYLERDVDRSMARTRARPLPSGRMEPAVALAFGLGLAAMSLPVLVAASNWLTGALGLLALLTYVGVYTPLKARSASAMLVGAIPGALPPLMGWTAVTGRFSEPGLVLFAILFIWQLPHFLAIALFRKEEYRAAGLHAVPLDRGDRAARVGMLFWTALLVPVSLLLVPLHIAGPLYLAVASVLGLGFFGQVAWGVLHGLGRGWARQSFFTSLIYLVGLFAALLLGGTAHL